MNAALIPSGWGFRFQPPLPHTRPGRGWGMSPAAKALRDAGPDLLRASVAALQHDVVERFGLTPAAAYSLVMRERLRALGGGR